LSPPSTSHLPIYRLKQEQKEDSKIKKSSNFKTRELKGKYPNTLICMITIFTGAFEMMIHLLIFFYGHLYIKCLYSVSFIKKDKWSIDYQKLPIIITFAFTKKGLLCLCPYSQG